MTHSEKPLDFDVVVIGAGFSGLGMLRRLRDELGLSVRVYETGSGVGGTWYWNRYPGARCDSESYTYCFTFSKELLEDWNWSGKYPEQPEILAYLNHVADRFDLRRDIQFNTRVASAKFVDDLNQWEVETDQGERVTAQFLITGIGCISAGNVPPVAGLESFQGDWFHTGSWPHEKVDFSGKRVAVIGTGSSGVQSIPVIAQEADQVTVFQRTPQYTVPARHGTVDRRFLEEEVKPNYEKIVEQMKWSAGGNMAVKDPRSALEVSAQERQRLYETAWAKGGERFLGESFRDVTTDKRANDTISEFIRCKIRETVKDPATAEKLLPTDHPFSSKRALVDTDYYETFNRDNVELVDIRRSPIEEITAKGIRTEDQEFEFDIIVFATGFDAMTGTFFKMDIQGRGNLALKDRWSQGPKSYLGLQSAGFPNLFMITGPGSPSVLTNMPVAIEQHIEWISDFIEYMREHDIQSTEAAPDSETEWETEVRKAVEPTMYMLANSWYFGANIPGKPRVFTPYAGGMGTYRKKCSDIAKRGYAGFILTSRRREKAESAP